jgi:pilus assembly protein CpaC
MQSRVQIAAALAVAAMLAGGVAARAQSPEELRVTLGKSIVLDYPEDVARISTSDPAVVDYVPVSNREIVVHAKGLGIATLIVWTKSGQRNFYTVAVELNLEPLRKLIKDTFPNEPIQLQSAREAVSLTGQVSSKEVADRATALVTPVAKNVVNSMRVRGAPVEKQVLLHVKFAELNRNASKTVGVNILSTGAMGTIGRVSTGQFSPPVVKDLRSSNSSSGQASETSYTIADALNIFAFRPDLNLAAFVRLLQQENLLQILAEPNLVTSNGKEASFLVGGEFPIPVVQGGSTTGAVTVQFREFGIRLTFNPLLTEHGTLKMMVRPEVSTIDLANSLTLNGFRIPALATRRIESNIELSPGQSFAIGGLIDDRATESFSRMPGLGSIPVLGALFKSREETKAKTELLVMVTPELVEPMPAGDIRASGPVMPLERLEPRLAPAGTAPKRAPEGKQRNGGKSTK